MDNPDGQIPTVYRGPRPGPGWRLSFVDAFLGGYLQSALVIAVVLAGLYLCFQLALPFLTPIATAFVLAVLFTPAHQRREAHFTSRSWAAGISVTVIAIAVIGFFTLFVAQLVREAASGAEFVRTAVEGGLVKRVLSSHPVLAPTLQGVLDQINVSGLLSDAASWLTNTSALFLRGSVLQIVGALFALYLLFYFLRDREQVLEATQSFLPFTSQETALIFRRIEDTVHATIYGMVVTGSVMGILGGALFAAVGLPAPLFWGLVMAVFAILPVLGMGMVWIPAVAFLALDSEWVRAGILAAGFIAITVADSFLYPALVGNRMKLHTALAFISAIGGLIVFGPAGFILGPLVVAVTLAIKEILRARIATTEALPANSPPV